MGILRKHILDRIRQIASCVLHRRGCFHGIVRRRLHIRDDRGLAILGGRLTQGRGQVMSLGQLFVGVCRSGTDKGLDSSHFSVVDRDCSTRRGRLRRRSLSVRRRVRMRRRRVRGVRGFIRGTRGCIRVRRLAPCTLHRLISTVCISTPSGSDKGQIRRVRVGCSKLKCVPLSRLRTGRGT